MDRPAWAAVAGVLAAGLVACGAPAVYFLTGYGCGDAEDRLGSALADEAVLVTAPAGAVREESYRTCDDDDLFVTAGSDYRLTAVSSGSPSPTDVLGHYRRAALADGWRAHSVPGCFTKEAGGTTAYLSVDEPRDGRYSVGVTADRARSSDWC
ncbi:hypothetical protein [Streptomyces sp. NPDC002328]|uniref:hypothetical protein n=1 Tax=Streptomyces sp. NPDC002328 TaxID=3364642 RepID=UPI0036A47EEC